MTPEEVAAKNFADAQARIAEIAKTTANETVDQRFTAYQVKSDADKTQALTELSTSFNAELAKKDASFSEIAEKMLTIEKFMESMDKAAHRNKANEQPNDVLNFSVDKARSIFASTISDDKSANVPSEFSAAQMGELEAYYNVSQMLYHGDGTSLNKATREFQSTHSGSRLSTFVPEVLTGEQLQKARAAFQNSGINFALVGAGAYNDPELLRNFSQCLSEPDNLLGQFGFRTTTKRPYRFIHKARNYAPAKFLNQGDCTKPPAQNIVIPQPQDRRVKPMGSMFCAHRDDYDDWARLGFADEIRINMLNSIIDGVNEEVMFGNGSNVDNWLDAIAPVNLSGLPAGAFVTWQTLTGAYDILEIQDKRNVKIYTSSLGRTAITTMSRSDSDPSSAVRYVNGILYVANMEVMTTNRSFHTPGWGNNVGSLQGMKPNFIIGDLKQLATLVEYSSPTVTRFTGANGSECDVWTSKYQLDFVVDCKAAALKLVSP